MPILLQLAQSYSNPDSVNYKVAYLRELMEQQFLNLGDLAYEDQVQLAMLGETIIIGGFLRTELLAAKSIFSHHLNVDALSAISADVGEVTAGLIKSADGNSYFDLTNNKIKTNNAEITGGKIEIDTASSDYNFITLRYQSGNSKYRANMSPIAINTRYVSGSTSRSANIQPTSIQVDKGTYYPDGEGWGTVVLDTWTTLEDQRLEFHGYNTVYVSSTQSRLKDLAVTGSKNRIVSTKSYGDVLQNAVESPTPLFVDIGHGVISEDGLCYIDIEEVFGETVDLISDYHIQLTKYGQGDIWVSEKKDTYFIVKGTPKMKFAWEIKAKQKGFSNERLEKFEEEKERPEADEADYVGLAIMYLEEYEKELIA